MHICAHMHASNNIIYWSVLWCGSYLCCDEESIYTYATHPTPCITHRYIQAHSACNTPCTLHTHTYVPAINEEITRIYRTLLSYLSSCETYRFLDHRIMMLCSILALSITSSRCLLKKRKEIKTAHFLTYAKNMHKIDCNYEKRFLYTNSVYSKVKNGIISSVQLPA